MARPLRILFVHDHLFLGGAAKAALRMRRICSELGHETLSVHGDEDSLPGLPSVALHGKGNRMQRLFEAGLPSSCREKLRRIRGGNAFGAFLKKTPFDLIWFQNIAGAKKWGWSEAWVAKALHHARVAITLHDMHYLGMGSSYVWERPVHPSLFAGMTGAEARALEQAGRLSLNACSSWLARLCKNLYGLPCGQLLVPLWPEDFGPEFRDRTGSGIIRYLVAAENLGDTRKNILPTLKCLRENGILERTRSEVRCLGRNLPQEFRVPQIVDLGHMEHPSRYRSLYGEVDFLFHPSLLDNFPLVIQESLAQGRPVVALERGGVGEMIRSGTTGYLYQETAAGVLESIFSTLSRQTAEEYQEMSRTCREYAVRNYSVSAAAAGYQSFLESFPADRSFTG
jgi:hypothetical protein